jgi:hypothetical protein
MSYLAEKTTQSTAVFLAQIAITHCISKWQSIQQILLQPLLEEIEERLRLQELHFMRFVLVLAESQKAWKRHVQAVDAVVLTQRT